MAADVLSIEHPIPYMMQQFRGAAAEIEKMKRIGQHKAAAGMAARLPELRSLLLNESRAVYRRRTVLIGQNLD